MIIKRFAPTRNADYRLVDRLFENLSTLANSSMNPLKRGEVFGLELFASSKEAYFTILIPDAHEDHLLESFKYAYKGAGFADHQRSLPALEHDSFYTLGVREHPFRPFKLKPEGELWNRMLVTFDSLRAGEEIRIQILLEPLYDDWREDYRAVYNDYMQTGSSIGGIGFKRLLAKGIRSLADAPKRALQQSSDDKSGHKIKDAEAKLSSSGMRTLLRVAIRSVRVTPLAHSVLASFRTMNHENEWQLEDVLRKKAFIRDWECVHLSRMSAPILCHDELRMFFQMPTEPSTLLLRMTPEEKSTDSRVTKAGIQIGHTYAFGKLGNPVYFVTEPRDDLNRTRLYIAPPGGGKTTQIKILWNQIARQGFGGALWDVADGKLYKEALEVVDERDAKRIIAIDYTNDKNPPVFNFSALAGTGNDASQMFAELFDVLFSGSDLVRSRNFMIKAAMATFAFPEHQFLEFILLMRDSDFRKRIIPRLRTRNPDLYLWWVRDFPRISDRELERMTAPILDRCEQLFNSNNKNLKVMMNGRGGQQSPRRFMDEAKLVHYNVSGGRFSEHEQRIIMAMHNQAYWAAILSREDLTINDRIGNPFFLLYDEPQTYMGATPIFSRAISKARKYGASCNFFIQDAEQVIRDNPHLWRELLGMKPHIMLGHVGEETAKHLIREFRPLKLDDLLEVEKYEYSWWLKTYADKRSVDPILVRAINPDEFLKKRDPRSDIVRSVLTYAGRNMKDMLEDISSRNMGMSIEDYRQALSSYEYTDQEGVPWESSDEDAVTGRK